MSETVTAPTSAHDVIYPGDRVYLNTFTGGRIAAVVTGAVKWSPTGLPSDATPHGLVKVTARRPLPGYWTGETVHTNDVLPRTRWRRSNGRAYRVGVSCLDWQPCEGCGRTTRLDRFDVALRHDAGTVTVTVTVVNGDRAKAVALVLNGEGAPSSAVESVTLTRTRYV